MKSLRLTNNMRDDIIESIRRAYKEKNPIPDVESAENLVGDTYYELSLHGKNKKSIRDTLFTKGLKPFLTFSKQIKVCIENEVHVYEMSEKRPVKIQGGDGWQAPIQYQSDVKNIAQKNYEDVKVEFEKWEIQLTSLVVEARQILCSVNTTKQLLEVWSEVEPLLPAYIADPSQGISLPAIPVTRLNERLGLGGSE